MADPDFIYDPDEWELTHPWVNRDDLAENCEVHATSIKKFATLIKGPDRFCVFLDGKYEWFSTVSQAEVAWKAAQFPQETNHE